MSDDSIDRLERSLNYLQSRGAPAELRNVILAATNRELAAVRWERRLARTTMVLLLSGIALNLLIGLPHEQRGNGEFASKATPESFVAAGVAIAEATDVETGQLYARHLAALRGSTLSEAQVSAIQHEVQKRALRTFSPKEG